MGIGLLEIQHLCTHFLAINNEDPSTYSYLGHQMILNIGIFVFLMDQVGMPLTLVIANADLDITYYDFMDDEDLLAAVHALTPLAGCYHTVFASSNQQWDSIFFFPQDYTIITSAELQ